MRARTKLKTSRVNIIFLKRPPASIPLSMKAKKSKLLRLALSIEYLY